MSDRLVVDLGADSQAKVLSWPDRGLPEEVSQAPLPSLPSCREAPAPQ